MKHPCGKNTLKKAAVDDMYYACNFPEVLYICCVHGRVAFKCCIHAKCPKISCIQNWKLLLRSLSVQTRKLMYVIVLYE